MVFPPHLVFLTVNVVHHSAKNVRASGGCTPWPRAKGPWNPMGAFGGPYTPDRFGARRDRPFQPLKPLLDWNPVKAGLDGYSFGLAHLTPNKSWD